LLEEPIIQIRFPKGECSQGLVT